MRVTLAVMGTVAAALAFLGGRWLLGFAYLAAAALIVRGQRRYGTVWLALRAFRRRDMQRVAALLRRIDHPDRLDPRHRAYHDWMLGIVAADTRDFERARTLLTRAAEGPLRTDQDRSIVHFHLAEIGLIQNEPDRAAHHLSEARTLARGPELLELIADLERRLKEIQA